MINRGGPVCLCESVRDDKKVYRRRMGREAMIKVMVTVCIVMFVGILLLPRGAMAFNQAQLSQVKATQKCQDCDLTGADLHGAELSFANLFDANLTGANLAGAKLDRANLGRANLFDANLTGANLAAADLTGANLTGADLTGAELTGAELFKATWADGSKCKSGSIGKCIK